MIDATKFILRNCTWLVAGLVLAASPAAAFFEQTHYIGEVVFVAYPFCPQGYAEANGQAVPIGANSALYSIFGNKYGGDGHSTFNLPNIPARSAANGPALIACIAMQGRYPYR